MSMPKGYQSELGYATVSSEDGCMGYREIAETMTSNGDKMNHSTARNVFLRALEKLADPVCKIYGNNDPVKMARDPRFQSCMQEIIEDFGVDI